MKSSWRKLLDFLFPPRRKRLELRYLSYAEADRLLEETDDVWTIAPEEDTNRVIGYVYLERLE
jgi:hypothetical protein